LSFPKTILILTVGVFSLIGVASLYKKKEKSEPIAAKVEEIILDEEIQEKSEEIAFNEPIDKEKPPEADQIDKLFALGGAKLPIVETITYTSRVPWLTGRPAWVADYASHYSTTRHFIARSLNQKPDYFTQKISYGDRFNVLKKDIDLEFYLVIDISRLKMWFYSHDKTNNEKILIKSYNVGLGRKDETKASKFLTPLGKYQLGDRVAIYKEGTKGYFQDQKIEMRQVFGTRWIPFDKEVSDCTEPAKGYGIHGAPWKENTNTGQIEEDLDVVGRYDSDGCIRLASKDVEEIFSIIITKPTTVEIVEDFYQADFLKKQEESGDN